MADTLLISAGEVIDVQLTSETVVMQTPAGGRPVAQPGHITNRMRLFVRDADGREQKYDFEDTELGVRETQRVVIVRGSRKRAREPVNLVLYNLSSGERDAFEPGLAAYLGRRPFFGPLWKAGVLALGVALVFWFVSNFIERDGQGGTMSMFFAAMFGFLTYPVFWWLCRVWDRITERMRYKAARKRFLKDMDARAQAHAATPAGATEPPARAQQVQAPPTAPPAAEPSGF